LSLYVQDRTTEGWEILQKLSPDILRDPHNSVYAAILLLDLNRSDEAKQYIAIAKRGPIYSEEKRLLEDEVNKASGISPTPTPTPSATPTPTPAPAREVLDQDESTPSPAPETSPSATP